MVSQNTLFPVILFHHLSYCGLYTPPTTQRDGETEAGGDENDQLGLRVDRLSAPILSIFTIINIGHFQNRFADFFYLFFFIMQTNILFTGDIIYC